MLVGVTVGAACILRLPLYWVYVCCVCGRHRSTSSPGLADNGDIAEVTGTIERKVNASLESYVRTGRVIRKSQRRLLEHLGRKILGS